MSLANKGKLKKDVIPKKLRFEVFKRDSFTCIYCGRRPPDVVLHADHRDPESKGGETSILNLVTSCLDCNLGKAAVPLNDNEFINKHLDDAVILQHKREQLKMIADWYKEISKHHEQLQEAIQDYFGRRVPGFLLAPDLLQRLARFAEKNDAIDCVFGAIVDLSAERIKYTPEKTATKESAEHISGKIEYVAKIKRSLKKLPHVNHHIDEVRYLFGILRRNSRLYEMPEVVRFYEVVDKIIESGFTIAHLISIAKDGNGFDKWFSKLDADGDLASSPRKSTNRMSQSAPNMASRKTFDSVPGFLCADSVFDDALLNDPWNSSNQECTLHLLNAYSTMQGLLSEFNLEDISDWAERAGPWVDQLYLIIRADLLYAWPELCRLPNDQCQARTLEIIETAFKVFFEEPNSLAPPSSLMMKLMSRATFHEDWHIVQRQFSLFELNNWLQQHSLMCCYKGRGAELMNVSPAHPQALEFVRDAMSVFVDKRFAEEIPLREVIETYGYAVEQQAYGLYLFSKDLITQVLEYVQGPVHPDAAEIFTRTIKNPVFAIANVLIQHDEDGETGKPFGGPEFLAGFTVKSLYIEMAMSAELSFPENEDLAQLLPRSAKAVGMDAEEFIELLTHGVSAKFGEFAQRFFVAK